MATVDLRYKYFDMALPNIMTFFSIVFAGILLKVGGEMTFGFIRISPEVIAFLAFVASISTISMNIYRLYLKWKNRKKDIPTDQI